MEFNDEKRDSTKRTKTCGQIIIVNILLLTELKIITNSNNKRSTSNMHML